VQAQVPAVDRYLSALQGKDLLVRLDWEQWLGITAPYAQTSVTRKEVTTRYSRNGYDWDIHGSLFIPERELDKGIAIVMFHGGAGSENIFDLTPDGRPGLGRVLAAQGFTALAVTYPGHWAPNPGGSWTTPVPERQPIYLLDRTLPEAETLDRNLKCTFNVILQGAAKLVDENLTGRRIIAFGHSTGGPMAAHLTRFVKTVEVFGIVGFGSGGPDGWRRQWRLETGSEKVKDYPVDLVSRRSPSTFRASGYEDPPDLCPWGGAEGYINWAQRIRSQMKTSLCDNQHLGNIEILEEYPKRTGLPREEYFDHMQDPDPAWLRKISVLLVAGDNDKGHWLHGEKVENKREPWMGAKYRKEGVKRAHVTVMPRYGHVGYCELHNEKIAYLWLWAYKSGYFA
jgi:pimeloyl-ACP methyl ester carboxylesterase